MRYILKDLVINVEARAVQRGDTVLKLPDLSFDTLVKLIEAAPNTVSIKDFAHAVWRTEHVSDETIAQRITLLRKALGDDPKNPTYIRTVRGLGYAITGAVERVENEPAPQKTSPLTPRSSFTVSTGTIAAGLYVLLVAAVMFLNTHNADSESVSKVTEVNTKSEAAILLERARNQLSLHQARETDRAIDMLRRALAQDPNNFDARLTLSFALTTKATKFGGNLDEKQEAEAIARALLDEQPSNSNAWSALAYTLGAQGRIEESLPAYQYAYQLNPNNAPAISSAAHAHLIRGELHQALLLELKAMQAGGASRYAEIQIAQVLELIGHPAMADWHTKALSLNPGQVVIVSEVARSHLRRGRPNAALEILAQATGDDQSAPQILQLRGRAAIMLGHLEEAQHLLEAAGDAASFDIAALNALTGNPSKAEALLLPAKIVELETSDAPDDRIHFAEVTAALGQPKEALRFLTQAVNLGWRDTAWLEHSPFLGALMLSNEGRQLETRIARDLEAQRRLIEGTQELTQMLGD
jgi:DNA-binding winged helix-turn-helix (wHTH) protein/Flp pilus assembly protein TadD